MRKRKVKKAIGVILLLLMYGLLFAISCCTTGIKTALTGFGAGTLVIVILATAVWLICG